MSKLEEFNENIKGKRVAIIGLGVSNLPLIKYFNDLDCEVVAFDNRDLEKIEKDTINKLEEYNCKYYTGQNALDDLKGFDYIFMGVCDGHGYYGHEVSLDLQAQDLINQNS